MAHPARNASPEDILSSERVFFVTTKTSLGRNLLQSERNATLLIDVLRSNIATGKFWVHDFVIMPNHLHVLLSVPGSLSIEKAMQLIKGGFSYRLKKELGYPGEIWQRGFSEVRVNDRSSFTEHRKYIAENPVRAGLAQSAEDWPFCYTYLVRHKVAKGNLTGPKGHNLDKPFGPAKAVP
jgi:putative transposase